MLFGQQLCRRHNRGLAAVFDGSDGCKGGDDGFAGTYIPLYQSQHRHVFLQVFQGFTNDPVLGSSQVKSQVVSQLPAEPRFLGKGEGLLFSPLERPPLHDNVVRTEFIKG